MKNQRYPSSSCFGPRSHIPAIQKVANGLSLRKPRRRKSRFESQRMKIIQNEVKKRQAAMQSIKGNKRGNAVRNMALMHSSETSDPSKNFSNKIGKGNYNVRSQWDNIVSQQARQCAPGDGNTSQLNALAVNKNLAHLAKSATRSNHSPVSMSKHTNQSPTSMLHNPLTSSTKDMKQSKSFRFRNELCSEELERSGPVRLKHASNAMPEHFGLSHRIQVKPGVVHNSNDNGGSSSRPNHLRAMAQLVHKRKNVGTFNKCNNVFLSQSKGRSNPYIEGDTRKDSTEKVDSLKVKEVFKLSEGSNISVIKTILHSNRNVSNEDKTSLDEVILHCHSSGDHHEQEDEAYEAPDSSSLLNDNQVMQVQSNLGNNPRNESGGCDGRTNVGKFERKKGPLLRNNVVAIDGIDAEGAVRQENVILRQAKKRRRFIETNGDEEANSGDQNTMVVEDDTAGLTVQAACSKDFRTKVSMPLISEFVKQQCHCCSKPIDKPIWSGIFKIGSMEYISFAGHLSTKSGKKVWQLSRSLLPVVKLTKLPRLEVWPKRWEASTPTDDDIGLYFFPPELRPNDNLDQLVKEVVEKDLVLRAVIGEAEMLILPSILLPKRYQMFQGKHYLWGLFKPREVNGVAKTGPEKSPEEGKQGVDQGHPSRDTKRTAEATAFGTNAAPMPTEATATATASDAPTEPPNHRQSASSIGVSSSRMIAFIARQTPRVNQLIQEIKQEGALLVAVRGEMIDAGSLAGNISTARRQGQA
ncbi:hypothetical protein ACP70R_046470 [Stipagrostis hirtigluma subsp. patula]